VNHGPIESATSTADVFLTQTATVFCTALWHASVYHNVVKEEGKRRAQTPGVENRYDSMITMQQVQGAATLCACYRNHCCVLAGGGPQDFQHGPAGGAMLGGGMQPMMMGAAMGPGWGPDPMMGGESPCTAAAVSTVVQ
jgi:hypothetical protein